MAPQVGRFLKLAKWDDFRTFQVEIHDCVHLVFMDEKIIGYKAHQGNALTTSLQKRACAKQELFVKGNKCCFQIAGTEKALDGLFFVWLPESEDIGDFKVLIQGWPECFKGAFILFKKA